MFEESNNDSLIFIEKTFSNEAFKKFEEIRRVNKLCDVTLNVDGRKFSAHRIVLCGSIPYFELMFTHDMVEACQRDIVIKGIDPDALESLINFAYNGKLCITINNVENLLMGSNFLQLNSVKLACEGFMKERLTIQNVLGVKQFADTHFCKKLIDECKRFINKNFMNVVENEEFLKINYNEIKELLDSDQLNLNSPGTPIAEEIVYRALIKWTYNDVEERNKHFEDLLKLVRLPLMSPQFIADNVSKEKLVKQSMICRDLVDEAKDYHLLPERRPNLKSFTLRPRVCSDICGKIYAIGGLNPNGDSLAETEFYDPLTGKWQSAEPMKTVRSRVGVAVYNGILYAIGGFDGTERLSTVEAFNIKEKKWNFSPPMNFKRSALVVTVLNGKLYVCGGYDGLSSLNTAECFDPIEKKWTILDSMKKHRSASGIATIDDTIMILGGHDGLSIFEGVECYSPINSKWILGKPMNSKRCRLGVALLLGKIYACGGYDGSGFLRSVESFCPISQQWTNITNMQIKRSRVALVSNGGRLYAIGGYDGAQNLSSVEMYDPGTEIWCDVASMKCHQGGVGIAVAFDE